MAQQCILWQSTAQRPSNSICSKSTGSLLCEIADFTTLRPLSVTKLQILALPLRFLPINQEVEYGIDPSPLLPGTPRICTSFTSQERVRRTRVQNCDQGGLPRYSTWRSSQSTNSSAGYMCVPRVIGHARQQIATTMLISKDRLYPDLG